MDWEEVNVISSANSVSGISVAKGSQLIDIRFNTKTIYIYLYGNAPKSTYSIIAQSD